MKSELWCPHLTLNVVMEASAPSPILHHDHSLVLAVYEERWSLHLGESELEIVVEVVQVEVEISDTATQLEQHSLIAGVNGESDKVFAHSLIELFILQTQYFHGCFAHLHQLLLWIGLIGNEILLEVDLLLDFLPHIVAKL